MDKRNHKIEEPEITKLESINQDFLNEIESMLKEEYLFSENWKEYIESLKDHLDYLKWALEDADLDKGKTIAEIEKTEEQLKNHEETYQTSLKFIDSLNLTKAKKQLEKDELENIQKMHKELLTKIIPSQES